MRSYSFYTDPPTLLALAVFLLLVLGVTEHYSAVVFAGGMDTASLVPFPPREFLIYTLYMFLALGVFIWVLWVDLRAWIHPDYQPLDASPRWMHRIPYYRVITVATFALLILVLFFGEERGGARRWLFWGQPGELSKVFLVMYLSRYISESEEDLSRSLTGWIPAGVVVGLLGLLIALQPNISTVVFLVMIFLAYMVLLAPLRGLLVMGAGAAGLLALAVEAFPHAARRVDAFLSGKHPEQVQMALAAIHEGGVLGKGPGRGVLKFEIPSAHNDFLFAVVGEEMGLVGMTLVILAFLVILWATWRAVSSTRLFDDERVLVYGAGMVLVLQAMVHIGVNLGVLPVTGQVLPFMSRGGSNLVVSAWCLGIVWKGVSESHS